MNQNTPNPIMGASDQAQPAAAPLASAREPYATPRLTTYGRFHHLTLSGESSTSSLQSENDEGVIDVGDA